MKNHVVVVSGDQGRRDFFNARSLDLQEGFRVLSGAVRPGLLFLASQSEMKIYAASLRSRDNIRSTPATHCATLQAARASPEE